MRARKDVKSTAQTLTSLRQEQGRQNSSVPQNERVRQRPFDEALRADLEWRSPNWKTGRDLPLRHPHNNGGNTNIETLDGEITIGGKSDGYRLFQSHIGYFSQIWRADIGECRARDGE